MSWLFGLVAVVWVVVARVVCSGWADGGSFQKMWAEQFVRPVLRDTRWDARCVTAEEQESSGFLAKAIPLLESNPAYQGKLAAFQNCQLVRVFDSETQCDEADAFMAVTPGILIIPVGSVSIDAEWPLWDPDDFPVTVTGDEWDPRCTTADAQQNNWLPYAKSLFEIDPQLSGLWVVFQNCQPIAAFDTYTEADNFRNATPRSLLAHIGTPNFPTLLERDFDITTEIGGVV
ncbi:hypothetical protein Pelo_13736 [Pelomyxa schiedti]|nr:hypothetical protein Pelo_13736 [Pelomyxa schiedti]